MKNGILMTIAMLLCVVINPAWSQEMNAAISITKPIQHEVIQANSTTHEKPYFAQSTQGSQRLSTAAVRILQTSSETAVSLPFHEDFEEELTGWSVWDRDEDGYSWVKTATNPRSGSSAVRVRWNANGNDDWLVSPLLKLPSAEASEVYFWASSSPDISYRESFEVWISIPAEDTVMKIAEELRIPNTYNEYRYDLAAYAGKQVNIAVVSVGVDEFYLYLDDFTVQSVGNNNDGGSNNFPPVEPDSTGFVFSTNAGGVWSETSTWVDGRVPADDADVFIGGPVQVDGSVQVKNLTVGLNGVLTNANTFNYTIDVTGRLLNYGSIANNDGGYNLTVALNGDVANFGTATFYLLKIVGNDTTRMYQHQDFPFEIEHIQPADRNASLFVESEVTFKNVLVNFGFSDTVGKITLNSNLNIAGSTEIISAAIIGNGNTITGSEQGGLRSSKTSLQNVYLDGVINVGGALQINDVVFNNGTLQNTSDFHQDVVINHLFVNNGIIRDNPEGYELTIKTFADITNNGTIQNERIRVVGSDPVTLRNGTQADWQPAFLFAETSDAQIVIGNPFTMKDSEVVLNGSTLQLQDNLNLVNVKITNGTLDGTGNAVFGSSSAILGSSLKIQNVSLFDTLNVSGTLLLGSNVINEGYLQNASSFHYDMIADEPFTNRGFIRNNPAGYQFTVQINQELHNYGRLENYRVEFVAGSDTIRVFGSDTAVFAPQFLALNATEAVVGFRSTMSVKGTTMQLNGGLLYLSGDLILSDGAQLLDGRLNGNGNSISGEANSGFGTSLFAENVTLSGVLNLFGNVSFGSNVINSGILQNASIFHQSLHLSEVFVNNGTVRNHPEGYSLTAELAGNLMNNGTWQPYLTRFEGTDDQLIQVGNADGLQSTVVLVANLQEGLAYQWYRDNQIIENQTRIELAFANGLVAADSGVYINKAGNGSESRIITVNGTGSTDDSGNGDGDGDGDGDGEIPSTVTDVDGNVYGTITVGNQVWLDRNLAATKLNDGTEIPHVPDATEWGNLRSAGYTWMNNDSSNKDTEGALYNWYAVDTGNLCPVGWHVPSDAEWNVFTDFLGDSNPAEKIKAETGWNMMSGTDEFGFAAIGVGERYRTGTFMNAGHKANFWSATPYLSTRAWYRTLTSQDHNIGRVGVERWSGYSVRCVMDAAPPVVETNEITTITSHTASVTGTIVSDGGAGLVGFGIVWGTQTNPTVDDNIGLTYTPVGESLSFEHHAISLMPNNVYYVRAYARNESNVGYGESIEIQTLNTGTVTDVEGNVYQTVRIGERVWMAENLRTTKLNDGTNIGSPTGSWGSSPAYAWYENNTDNKDSYGALYNHAAVSSGLLCPVDWDVPSELDWALMVEYMGAESASKLKSVEGWDDANNGVNAYGLNIIPAGARSTTSPYFFGQGDRATFWTSTTRRSRYLQGSMTFMAQIENDNTAMGYSVRCATDPTVVSIPNDDTQTVNAFTLLGAWPNPFNPITSIGFAIPEAGMIAVDVYTSLGQHVTRVTNAYYSTGQHVVPVNAENWSSGVYIYTVQYNNSVVTGKMTLVK